MSKLGINIKRNDFQAQLWTVPGPLFTCCILLAIVLRSSFTPLLLPITAVAGVVVCNLWKWRGVAVSSAILGSIMVYVLQSQPSHSWIWTIALSLTIASTFVLTVLCSEEAYQALNQLNKDSSDHKQTLSLLNERLHLMQTKMTAEQNEFILQKNQWQEQLTAKEEKQRFNEQLLKLARNEITTALKKQETVLQELFKANEKKAAMEAKIAELQSLQVSHDHVLQEEHQTLQQEQQKLFETIALQNEAMMAMTSEKDALMKQMHRQQLEVEHQEKSEAINHSEIAEVEEVGPIKHLYHQLREQFAEKSEILNQTRKELFLSQEELLAFQIERKEAETDENRETMEWIRIFANEAERELNLMEYNHSVEVCHLQEVIASLLLPYPRG